MPQSPVMSVLVRGGGVGEEGVKWSVMGSSFKLYPRLFIGTVSVLYQFVLFSHWHRSM